MLEIIWILVEEKLAALSSVRATSLKNRKNRHTKIKTRQEHQPTSKPPGREARARPRGPREAGEHGNKRDPTCRQYSSRSHQKACPKPAEKSPGRYYKRFCPTRLYDPQKILAFVYTMEYNERVKYTFEWDNEKDEANFEKHEVWFDEAKTIWADPHSQETFDPDHSDEEDRFVRFGVSTLHRTLLVVFCERENGYTIRIISARKATPRERKQYEEGI